MSQNENSELNAMMASGSGSQSSGRKAIRKASSMPASIGDEDGDDAKTALKGLVQWTTSDGKRFLPASHTTERLTPGVYDIMSNPNIGIFFEKIPVKTDGLIRFPQTNSNKVISEIAKFWDREDIFRQYNLTHKRGILLWGPPGSGKSCTIKIIMEDVVSRGGIVVKFTAPSLFTEGIRILREIQQDTPIVILMEDIDSILDVYNESEVLNILDGVDQVDKAVFLATTNYPERLGPRIVNRPSRFDKRFKIGHPNAESRKMYFEHIIGGDEQVANLNILLDKWVEDTEGFSIAHLQELFVATIILGDSYDDAIETLNTMKEIPSSEDDIEKMMGFHNAKKTSNGGFSKRS